VRLEVLGFAGAAPLQGACPSYVVSADRTAVLLDCGPGTLERLWRRSLLGRLDAIVLSHMHADHVLDLVMLAGELARELSGDRRIPLYAPEANGREVLAGLDGAFARTAAAQTRFDAAFEVVAYDADAQLEVGQLSFTFAATDHAQPCYAACASDGNVTFVYGADGGPTPPFEALAAEAHLLVLEATYLDDEQAAAAHRHMTAAQAGSFAARAGASRLLLTHTLAGVDAGALAMAAASVFSGPIDVAHEGFAYENAASG
jgi:ribonuclease BN (tRNA processing enzyme)